MFGLDTPLCSHHRDLMTLKPSEGGLGMIKLDTESGIQYASSKKITTLHVQSIQKQSMQMLELDNNGRSAKQLRSEANHEKQNILKQHKEDILNLLPDDVKPYVEQATDKGASAWLNALLIREQNLNLNKQEFHDTLCIRYGMKLPNLPSKCVCNEPFTVNHSLVCKIGDYI